MANETLIAEAESQIERDRSLLELLESGKLRVGDGPSLRGHGDRTQAQIHDLKRKIAMNVALLESYR